MKRYFYYWALSLVNKEIARLKACNDVKSNNKIVSLLQIKFELTLRLF